MYENLKQKITGESVGKMNNLNKYKFKNIYI